MRQIMISDGHGGNESLTDTILEATYEGVAAGTAANRDLRLAFRGRTGDLLPSTRSKHVHVHYRLDVECSISMAPDIEVHLPVSIYQPAPPVWGLAAMQPVTTWAAPAVYAPPAVHAPPQPMPQPHVTAAFAVSPMITQQQQQPAVTMTMPQASAANMQVGVGFMPGVAVTMQVPGVEAAGSVAPPPYGSVAVGVGVAPGTGVGVHMSPGMGPDMAGGLSVSVAGGAGAMPPAAGANAGGVGMAGVGAEVLFAEPSLVPGSTMTMEVHSSTTVTKNGVTTTHDEEHYMQHVV